MAHLKKSGSTGHLLKNTAHHLITACGNTNPCYSACAIAAVFQQLFTAPGGVPSVTISGNQITTAAYSADAIIAGVNDSFACSGSCNDASAVLVISSGTGGSWQATFNGATAPSFTTGTGYTTCPPLDDHNATSSAWTRIASSPNSPIYGWAASQSLLQHVYAFSSLLPMPDTTQTLTADLMISNFSDAGMTYTASPANPIWDGTLVCTSFTSTTQTWRGDSGANLFAVLAAPGQYIDNVSPGVNIQQGGSAGSGFCDQYNVSFILGTSYGGIPEYARNSTGSPLGYLPFYSRRGTAAFIGPYHVLLRYT